jgi:hypothetical protein
MFEIFYSYGGRAGPYQTLRQARHVARSKLASDASGRLEFVEIRRPAADRAGYGHLVEKVHRPKRGRRQRRGA